jgi:hypothetical protein
VESSVVVSSVVVSLVVVRVVVNSVVVREDWASLVVVAVREDLVV